MKRIIAILLVISIILPILPVYAEGKVIEIDYKEIDSKRYAYAMVETSATEGTGGTRFRPFGWNIKFGSYNFLYEIDATPGQGSGGTISAEYQIPLIDGSGLELESI